MTEENEPAKPPRASAILTTLAEVERAAEQSEYENPAFVEAVDRFRSVFREQMNAQGDADWDELVQLREFELLLAKDRDLDVGYAAACKTVRDYLTFHRHQQAKLN